jgi:hypothetical protein
VKSTDDNVSQAIKKVLEEKFPKYSSGQLKNLNLLFFKSNDARKILVGAKTLKRLEPNASTPAVFKTASMESFDYEVFYINKTCLEVVEVLTNVYQDEVAAKEWKLKCRSKFPFSAEFNQ